jgi:DNA recombination protein RmuC
MGFTLSLILSVISIGLSAVTFLTIRRLMGTLNKPDEFQNQLKLDLQASLAKNSVELSTAIVKTTGDLRQDLSDRLNDKFLSIGHEINVNLKTGRDELRDGLIKTTASLETKFTTLEGKVSDRLESIGREVQTKLDKNIQDGFAHFQKVQESLAGAEKQLSNLNAVGQSIQELNNVLNLPHLRGKIIGEGNLERLLSDFLPVGYFEMQYQIEGAFVDCVIKFPHLGMVLPIDSKFSMEQVAALYDHSSNPDEMKAARKRLSEVVKQNARDIKNKYIKPKAGTTDYALMYLPSETLYFEIVRDTELWGMLAEYKVFPVSPNTLAITVNSIGKSLQYYEMAKGVNKTIRQVQLAREHLEHFKNRFDEIGDRLVKAQESFQKASTHLSHYSSSVDRLESAEDTIAAITEAKPTKSMTLPLPPLAVD